MAQTSSKRKRNYLTRLMIRGRRWEPKRASKLAASMQTQQEEKQIWVRQLGRADIRTVPKLANLLHQKPKLGGGAAEQAF
jgi:hypothetical protein